MPIRMVGPRRFYESRKRFVERATEEAFGVPEPRRAVTGQIFVHASHPITEIKIRVYSGFAGDMGYTESEDIRVSRQTLQTTNRIQLRQQLTNNLLTSLRIPLSCVSSTRRVESLVERGLAILERGSA